MRIRDKRKQYTFNHYTLLTLCSICPQYQNKTCPCIFSKEGYKAMFNPYIDPAGEHRCRLEANYLNKLKKTFMLKNNLSKNEEPFVDMMLLDFLMAYRASKYVAQKGLVQITKVKDKVSGQVHDIEIQNILKKDIYFDQKLIREWADSLQVTPKSKRLIDTDKDDVAIVFSNYTKELEKAQKKSIEAKGSVRKLKKLFEKGKEKVLK